jgi:hypothetical protein
MLFIIPYFIGLIDFIDFFDSVIPTGVLTIVFAFILPKF